MDRRACLDGCSRETGRISCDFANRATERARMNASFTVAFRLALVNDVLLSTPVLSWVYRRAGV